LNEELVTVNSELQGKIDELTEINNDMKNLLDSIQIATIFMSNNLKIKRFTPEANKIINLIASDVGCPSAHIASNLKCKFIIPLDSGRWKWTRDKSAMCSLTWL
jgi:two-component system CheB/CheR fusion protein